MEILYIAGRNENGVATVKKNLLVLQKVKHRITLWSINFTPRYIPKRNAKRYLNEYIYKHIYSSIHNSQKVEQVRISINNGWINQLQNTHTMEYHSSIKKNSDRYNLHEP